MDYTNLNDNQKKAVTVALKPTMVIAGPGSGKTHVIIHRVGHMLEAYQCNPYNILVITFTKVAAEEMKQRFNSQFGISTIQFGTFHSVFYKMLRVKDPQRYALDNLISEEKKKKTIEEIYRHLQGEDEDFLESFLAHLTLMKNQLIQPKFYNPDGLSKEIYLKVYYEYENFKERQQLFDFDDMLVDCYYLLINEPDILKLFRDKYRHILIDEFQDINLVQFEVIKLLCEEHRDIFIVGDDDQSIYCFRGAKPEFLVCFEQYFKGCEKIILDINYRSTQNILYASNKLISCNKQRYPKIMKTVNPKGILPIVKECHDPKEQAELVLKEILQQREKNGKFSDMAVVYRTNIQARPIIEVLLATNIPFLLRESIITLYDQWVTKDILAYFKSATNFDEKDALKRIINRPSRYISKVHLFEAEKLSENMLLNLLNIQELNEWQKDSIQELIYHLQTLKNKEFKQAVHYIRKVIGYDKYILEYTNYRKIPSAGLMEILDEIEESTKNYSNFQEWEESLKIMSKSIKEHSKKFARYEGVTLTTMHGAKGLEFKSVFIIDAVEGVTPHHKSNSDSQLEEERRLFYVAMTRACEYLAIYVPKLRYEKKVEPSAFLLEFQMLGETEDLKGKNIIHKQFGKGKIIDISKRGIEVRFESGIIKIIEPKISFKKNLIKLEEDYEEK